MVNELLRRLARDQWVRLHGTPRVTVLVGARAREVYRSWLALAETTAVVHEADELDRSIREACAHASACPADTVAIFTTAEKLSAWRAGRSDRLAAMIDEGLIAVDETPAVAAAPPAATAVLDARSAAEAAMFEALEATPATAGRFKLNEYLSVRFGSVACEVDLLSRADDIAIEIDGYHHFSDPSRYRRDRRKDLLLQMQGLIVIRVLAEDVLIDPREAVTTVCQAMAHRRAAP